MFPITTGGNKENKFQRGDRIYLGKPNEPLGCRAENTSETNQSSRPSKLLFIITFPL